MTCSPLILTEQIQREKTMAFKMKKISFSKNVTPENASGKSWLKDFFTLCSLFITVGRFSLFLFYTENWASILDSWDTGEQSGTYL